MIKIDMLYFLLFGELLFILLLSVVYLSLKNRKYRQLYRKALTGLSAEPAAHAAAETAQEPAASPSGQEAGTMVEAVDAAPDGGPEEEGTPQGRIRKLKRIVNLQKDKILDLMCYKDIFEGAQKKLSTIQVNNRDLQEKIKALGGSSGDGEGFAAAVGSFESNNRDLEEFIRILEKENVNLSQKFAAWQEELKNIWAGADSAEGIDEGRYAELLKEKDELVAKMREFEEKLQDKSNQLEDMQKQYEDIEKEYMILYKQQQQAGSQPDV